MDNHNAPLSVGLFVSNRRLRAPLYALLSMAGYRIAFCGKQKLSQAAFLEELLERLEQIEMPPYDLLVLETAVTELVGHTRSCLVRLASMRTLPVIVLTDSSDLELSQRNVTIVPVWKVLQSQREQYQALVKAKQARIGQCREWATQRQEWISQQHL